MKKKILRAIEITGAMMIPPVIRQSDKGIDDEVQNINL